MPVYKYRRVEEMPERQRVEPDEAFRALRRIRALAVLVRRRPNDDRAAQPTNAPNSPMAQR